MEVELESLGLDDGPDPPGSNRVLATSAVKLVKGRKPAVQPPAKAAPSNTAMPSSVIEVFVGGLESDVSEASLRFSIETAGLLPQLVWTRLVTVDEEQYRSRKVEEETSMLPDAGKDGRNIVGKEVYQGSCTGIAYLGFSSRLAAEEACRLVKQVDGAHVALHISRCQYRALAALPPGHSHSLPLDGMNSTSNINCLLLRLRCHHKKEGSVAVAASVQDALAEVFNVCGRRPSLSLSLSEGGSAGSGGRDAGGVQAAASTLAKRQAVGEPSNSSPLKRQDLECSTDDDDYHVRPSFSSSAGSVPLHPPAGSPRSVGKERRGSHASFKKATSRVSTLAGGASGRGALHQGNSAASLSQRSPSPCTASAGEGTAGAGESSGANGKAGSAISEALLESYPETKLALEAYRGSKQGAQLQSMTPLTILNQHANRMRVEVSFSEQAETPTGPFTIIASIPFTYTLGPFTPSSISGTGKARVKREAKQVAAASILEELLPLLRSRHNAESGDRSRTSTAVSLSSQAGEQSVSGNQRSLVAAIAGSVSSLKAAHNRPDKGLISSVEDAFRASELQSVEVKKRVAWKEMSTMQDGGRGAPPRIRVIEGPEPQCFSKAENSDYVGQPNLLGPLFLGMQGLGVSSSSPLDPPLPVFNIGSDIVSASVHLPVLCQPQMIPSQASGGGNSRSFSVTALGGLRGVAGHINGRLGGGGTSGSGRNPEPLGISRGAVGKNQSKDRPASSLMHNRQISTTDPVGGRLSGGALSSQGLPLEWLDQPCESSLPSSVIIPPDRAHNPDGTSGIMFHGGMISPSAQQRYSYTIDDALGASQKRRLNDMAVGFDGGGAGLIMGSDDAMQQVLAGLVHLTPGGWTGKPIQSSVNFAVQAPATATASQVRDQIGSFNCLTVSEKNQMDQSADSGLAAINVSTSGGLSFPLFWKGTEALHNGHLGSSSFVHPGHWGRQEPDAWQQSVQLTPLTLNEVPSLAHSLISDSLISEPLPTEGMTGLHSSFGYKDSGLHSVGDDQHPCLQRNAPHPALGSSPHIPGSEFQHPDSGERQRYPPMHQKQPFPALQQQQQDVQDVLADVQRLLLGAGLRGVGETASAADAAWVAAGMDEE